MAVEQFEKSNGEGTALFVLKHTRFLLELFRSGLVAAMLYSGYRKLSTCGYYWWRYRRVALASLLASGIPFTIYERDNGFEARSQGYGLTLQQASKAIKDGCFLIRKGVISTRHLVHTTDGKVNGVKMDAVRGAKSPKNQYTYRKAILRFAPRTTRWT
jgi:hypothetical protein